MVRWYRRRDEEVVVVLWQDLDLAHHCLPTHGCRTHWALTRTSPPIGRGPCLCSAHGTCGPPPLQSGQH